jgi:alkylation response protein AidB-like acyl-CoA dehydrogenase
MEIEFSAEQSLLLSSVEKLLAKYRRTPTHDVAYVRYSPELRCELAEGGFLGICLQDGYGPLDAALLTESVARLPWSAEVAASVLIPHALKREIDGPIALCEGIGRSTRFLPQARHACILTDAGVRIAELGPHDAEPMKSVVAYPLGKLRAMPAQSELLDRETSSAIRTLWRVAIAAEAAGLMRGALDLTVSHVKERRQFDRPLGDFQGIQHRLASNERIVSAAFLLAMRAAFSMRPDDAATAALYAQQHMRSVIHDCHQFTGAMGVTLEYPLHLWTYRLKFLQGELGGYTAQAAALAEMKWPNRGQHSDLQRRTG